MINLRGLSGYGNEDRGGIMESELHEQPVAVSGFCRLVPSPRIRKMGGRERGIYSVFAASKSMQRRYSHSAADRIILHLPTRQRNIISAVVHSFH